MKVILAVLFAATLAAIGSANAGDGCGPGCHTAVNGGCVVDGWGAPGLRNECPAGAQPHRPCYYPYVWRSRYRACFHAN
jgi:hypothetical protein